MSSLLPPDVRISTQVIGTAYLDEVVDVEGALCPGGQPRIDYSRTEARRAPLADPGTFLLIETPGGDRIRVTDAHSQGGRRITLTEDRIVDAAGEAPPLRSEVVLKGRRVLLGGMGPGYALALGARLVSPVGGQGEEGREVRRLLDVHAITCDAVPVEHEPVDTTVLIWSSAGDKLPIGRRTASTAVSAGALLERCTAADLTLVTSLPNATVAALVGGLSGWIVFTPSLRNVCEGGLDEIAPHVDAISMNRTEWQGAEPQVGERCPLVVVMEGGRWFGRGSVCGKR